MMIIFINMFLHWIQLHEKDVVSTLIYVCIMDLLGTQILVWVVDKDNRKNLRKLLSW